MKPPSLQGTIFGKRGSLGKRREKQEKNRAKIAERKGKYLNFSSLSQKIPVTHAKKQKNYGQTAGFVVN
jgi:hypothetical protein